MVFDWFKKVNHALQTDTNNGQAHDDNIETEKIKILKEKIHRTHLSKFKGN